MTSLREALGRITFFTIFSFIFAFNPFNFSTHFSSPVNLKTGLTFAATNTSATIATSTTTVNTATSLISSPSVDVLNFSLSLDEKAKIEPAKTPESKPLATSASSANASPTTPPNHLSYLGHTVPIFTSYDTLTDSGTQIGLYNDKFLYGHNSWNVFGDLPSLAIGDTLTINLNGKAATYRVSYVTTLDKATTQRFMLSIANARFDGVQYSYSLMTCAGTSVGNGDASHRLILFVDEF